jgi:hypothetical protein
MLSVRHSNTRSKRHFGNHGENRSGDGSQGDFQRGPDGSLRAGLPGNSAADWRRDMQDPLEGDSQTDSCGGWEFGFPADLRRDSKADSRRDLQRDLQGDFHGDFDGALRVEAEDEAPRTEARRTKAAERRRTARVADGGVVSYAEGAVAGFRLKRSSNSV